MSAFESLHFLLATELEARPILKDSSMSWRYLEDERLYFSESSGACLSVVGIGPSLAAHGATRAALLRPTLNHWLNLGVAGSLRPSEVELGDIYSVDQVASAYEKHPFERVYDKLLMKAWFPSSKKRKVLSCISVGEPLHDESLRTKLSEKASMVDMELHALAVVAREESKDLASLKIVSDFASETDAKMIVKRIPRLMTELWGQVKSSLR